MIEKIICAAIYYKNYNGEVLYKLKNINSGIVIFGPRHSHCFETLSKITKYKNIDIIQGFLTSNQNFLDRKEAYDVALKAGQIKEKKGIENELFSEDLY